MSVLLMKWISILSAIWSVCTCLAILAQTLEDAVLPLPLLLCRLFGTSLAMSQFVCSILIYFKLQQRSNAQLWGMPFYMFTTTAFCITVNYFTYTCIRLKYSYQQDQPYVDLSIIDTCMALEFAIFIIFHLVIIFDCYGHKDDKDSNVHNLTSKRTAIPYQIFTIESLTTK